MSEKQALQNTKPVPGMEGVKAPAVAPDEAIKIIESRPLPPNIYNPNVSAEGPGGIAAFAGNTVPGPASIVELARALKNDVDLIHQWTQDNLDFTPTFGSQKGAVGAIVDGLGSSADIADVFVQLCRQAGLTANYMFGELELTPQQVADWLGTDPNNIFAASNLLSYGGIPNTVVFGPTRIRLSHMWVKVYNVGGQDVVFDPAFKTYTVKPTADLATIMSYNQTTFINSAKSGSTETPDYIQNINRTNLRDNLQTHAMNLVNYVRTNNFAATTDDIIGGRNIVPWSAPVRQTSLPYQNPNVTPIEWTDIPVAYKARLRVQYDVIDVTFNSADIHTRRLSLFFNASHQAELRLDGTLVATSNPQFGFNSVLFTVTHPYPSTFADRSFFQRIDADQRYLLAQSWGSGGRTNADRHRKKQDQAVLDGLANTSEGLYGEALATVFHTYDGQQCRTAEIIDRFTNCTTVFHHQIGLVANTNNFLFIDMGSVVVGTGHYSQDNNKIALNNVTLAMHGVAIEEAIFPQMTGIAGASATRMIDIGAASGNKIFNAASGNWSGTVRPQLTGWDSGVLNQIESFFINQGWRVVLPEQGNLPVGIFTGYGYDAIFPGNGGVLGFLGLFKGGSVTNTIPPGPVTGGRKRKCKCECEENDPITIASGEYIYRNKDISVGSQDAPYSLSFERYYNSGDRQKDSPLGLGWSHNWRITAKADSDGFQGLGADSPVSGAATIAQLFIAVDLLTDPARPLDKFLITSLSDQWWVDQINGNTVEVKMPEEEQLFVKLPDGSYNPPHAVHSTLVKNGNGSYTYTTPQQVAYNFDATTGNITTIVYPYGVTLTFAYTSGNLTSVTNGMGRTLTLSYTSGRLTSVSDGTGRSVSFIVNASKNLTSFTNADSRTTTYTYAAIAGLMTQFFKPANPGTAFVTNTFDTLDRVNTHKNARNQQWTYYLAGSRSEEVDPVNNKRIWFFNADGSAKKEIDGVGNVTLREYDGLDRLVKVTMPQLNRVEFTLDSKGNVLTERRVAKPGSPLADLVKTFTYHPTFNKVATATDAMGRTTTYSYNPTTGQLLMVQRPQVGGQTPTIVFTYNTRGQVLTRIDETLIVSQFNYDSSTERLLSIVHDFGVGRLNLTTQFGHNSRGDVTSVTDARNNTTGLQYDLERRLTQRTEAAPFNYVTNIGYDFDGNQTSVQRETGDPLNPWQTFTIGYSVTDKRTSIVDPSNHTTVMEYDGADRLWKITDAENRLYQLAYDQANRLFTVTDPTSVISETRLYSGNGKLSSIADARSNVTQFTFDGHDRADKTIFADLSYQQNVTRDANGNVLLYRTRSGYTITRVFDVLNRVTSKAPQKQPVVSYSYDLAGRLLTASTPVVPNDPGSGSLKFTFDSAGRHVKEDYPDGKAVKFSLDANGNISSILYPDGYFVDRVWDNLNRLTDIKLNGAVTPAVHIDYDRLSRRTAMTYENGVITSYEHELDNDLATLKHVFTGSTQKFTYGYNNVHQMTSQDVSDAQYLWHPGAGGTTAYGVANSVNEYPSVGGQNFTYDGNANLATDGVNKYSFDTENHLLTANLITGNTLWYYRYDAVERQAQKEVSPNKTRFIYSGWQRIADYDGVSGALQSRYVYGDSLDDILIKVDAVGTKTYYSKNHQGSVVALSDATGTVSNRFKYGPFGESPSLSGTSHGYTGQRFDSETGLYYYKNRHFLPRLGRFLQTERLRISGGSGRSCGGTSSCGGSFEPAELNLYTYVQNDPLNQRDPLGLFPAPVQEITSAAQALSRGAAATSRTNPVVSKGLAIGSIILATGGVIVIIITAATPAKVKPILPRGTSLPECVLNCATDADTQREELGLPPKEDPRCRTKREEELEEQLQKAFEECELKCYRLFPIPPNNPPPGDGGLPLEPAAGN